MDTILTATHIKLKYQVVEPGLHKKVVNCLKRIGAYCSAERFKGKNNPLFEGDNRLEMGSQIVLFYELNKYVPICPVGLSGIG
jgi:hypothetical protein